jgi:hypothetical protein
MQFQPKNVAEILIYFTEKGDNILAKEKPNLVNNYWEIAGEPNSIDRFLDFMKSTESNFDFNKILPCSADSRQQTWGTQVKAFGIRAVYITSEDGFQAVDFCTEISPPHKVISHLAKKFPELEFSIKFDIRDMDLSGYQYFLNGERVINNKGRYEEFCGAWDNEGEWDSTYEEHFDEDY